MRILRVFGALCLVVLSATARGEGQIKWQTADTQVRIWQGRIWISFAGQHCYIANERVESNQADSDWRSLSLPIARQAGKLWVYRADAVRECIVGPGPSIARLGGTLPSYRPDYRTGYGYGYGPSTSVESRAMAATRRNIELWRSQRAAAGYDPVTGVNHAARAATQRNIELWRSQRAAAGYDPVTGVNHAARAATQRNIQLWQSQRRGY